jgi:hypothetical protein
LWSASSNRQAALVMGHRFLDRAEDVEAGADRSSVFEGSVVRAEAGSTGRAAVAAEGEAKVERRGT